VALVISLLVALACSCAKTKAVLGEAGGAAVEYIACPVIPGLNCGHVFLCDTPADNPLGKVEICIDDDADDKDDLAFAEMTYGTCEPTPRHQGICAWCPEEKGCNAFSGCFNCPPEDES
jgi:hypothetical protein